MAKLHEVLAVESGLEGQATKIRDEAIATFKSKPHLFQGKVRTLELFAGDDEVSKKAAEDAERQVQVLVTTVPDKLKYVWDTIIPHWDAVAQKEATNQQAKSDVIVNGTTIMTDVPVTYLLSLESKLKKIRELYEVIPTLEPNIAWQDAPELGANIKRAPEVSTLKTAKEVDYRVIVPATDKHQAQVAPQEKVKNVGVYKATVTSGLVTPSQKSLWLGKIDDLIRAVKQARQRANEQQIVSINSASAIARYIHGDELNQLASDGASAA
jgi:hypothetical protein